MYKIVYKKEVIDKVKTKDEAEYIAAEYNCAFRENGAVKVIKVR